MKTKKYDVRPETLNKFQAFLLDVKKNSENDFPESLTKLCVKNHVGRSAITGLVTSNLIKRLDGNKYQIFYLEVEPIHARRLAEAMNDYVRNVEKKPYRKTDIKNIPPVTTPLPSPIPAQVKYIYSVALLFKKVKDDKRTYVIFGKTVEAINIDEAVGLVTKAGMAYYLNDTFLLFHYQAWEFTPENT